MIIITTVNWSDLKTAAGEAGFDALPPSEYDVIVDTATVKQVANNSKSAIAVQFKVENGPYQSKRIFNNFVLSPDNANALAFFFRHMAAMGLGDAYFAANPPLERVAADLTGRRCRITLSVRQWQGQDRNNVDTVKPPAGPANPSPAPGGMTQVPPVPGAAPAPPVPATAVPGPPVPNAAPPVPPVPPPPAPAVTPEETYAQATGQAPPPPPGDEDLPF